MAALRNLQQFNAEKDKRLKLKTETDEIVLLSESEARSIIRDILAKELDVLAEEKGMEIKRQIEDRLVFKLKQIEISLAKHIDEKILALTDKVISAAITSRVQSTVDTKVIEKLNKIERLVKFNNKIEDDNY